jgi:hypothetical protein
MWASTTRIRPIRWTTGDGWGVHAAVPSVADRTFVRTDETRSPAPAVARSEFRAWATKPTGIVVFRFRRSVTARAPHVPRDTIAPNDPDQLGYAGRRSSEGHRRELSVYHNPIVLSVPPDVGVHDVKGCCVDSYDDEDRITG